MDSVYPDPSQSHLDQGSTHNAVMNTMPNMYNASPEGGINIEYLNALSMAGLGYGSSNTSVSLPGIATLTSPARVRKPSTPRKASRKVTPTKANKEMSASPVSSGASPSFEVAPTSPTSLSGSTASYATTSDAIDPQLLSLSTYTGNAALYCGMEVPATAMPDFKYLPEIVRERIWKGALPGVRVFEIVYDSTISYVDHPIKFDNNEGVCTHNQPLPGIFMACKESRAVGMRVYMTIRPRFLNKTITYNPKTDVIFLSSFDIMDSFTMWGTTHDGRLPREDWSKFGIQKFAIDPTLEKIMKSLDSITTVSTQALLGIARNVHAVHKDMQRFTEVVERMGPSVASTVLIAESRDDAADFLPALMRSFWAIKHGRDELRRQQNQRPPHERLFVPDYKIPQAKGAAYPPSTSSAQAVPAPNISRIELQVENRSFVPYHLRVGRANSINGVGADGRVLPAGLTDRDIALLQAFREANLTVDDIDMIKELRNLSTRDISLINKFHIENLTMEDVTVARAIRGENITTQQCAMLKEIHNANLEKEVLVLARQIREKKLTSKVYQLSQKLAGKNLTEEEFDMAKQLHDGGITKNHIGPLQHAVKQGVTKDDVDKLQMIKAQGIQDNEIALARRFHGLDDQDIALARVVRQTHLTQGDVIQFRNLQQALGATTGVSVETFLRALAGPQVALPEDHICTNACTHGRLDQVTDFDFGHFARILAGGDFPCEFSADCESCLSTIPAGATVINSETYAEEEEAQVEHAGGTDSVDTQGLGNAEQKDIAQIFEEVYHESETSGDESSSDESEEE